jgi:hypothetical protein
MAENLDRQTENIGVMVMPAMSDVMVITFAHMDFDITAGHFWGQEAIRKAGYAGMGLICRSNSWFPEQDVQELSDYMLEQAKTYKTTVLYGFSMGAYAAIKYSRLLRADCSIALSPQFSIDPADVFGHDQRLMRHYDPRLNAGMAITQADMAGSVYMFYDPYVAPDQWNCAMIRGRAGPEVELRTVLVPRIGHETIDVFSGTERLKNLVRYCLDADMDGLRRLTADSRRRAERRIFNSLTALRKRAPARAEALFAAYHGQLGEHWRRQWTAVD